MYYIGYHENVNTKKKVDFFEKNDKMLTMNNVVCIFNNDYISILLGNRQIGTVQEVNGEPTMFLGTNWKDSVMMLTFTDVEIIQDNWAAFKECENNILEKIKQTELDFVNK